MANIRINDEQMKSLKEYELATGVRAARCVEEAVNLWLECIAPARIESLQRQAVRLNENGVGGGFAVANDSHPHVKITDVVAQGLDRMKSKVKK